MSRMFGPTGSRRRRRSLFGAIGSFLLLVLVLVPSAQAVLSGSPSNMESGNDPSLGLGNMIVNTTGNNDWATVDFNLLTDAAASNSDDSFTPGQKQDTVCPTVEGHKNPPKDDFTHIASFTEVNATTGDTFLYGATIRYTSNGNASENIELKQGTNGFCPGSTTLLQRVAGDKLIAIDYLGGGSAVQFHILTWVTSGACFVGSHSAPCWGATVLDLTGTGFAEGGVNGSQILAANNPISNAVISAGQFAEFGINLSGAGIIPAGSCKSFSQTIWESRSSGSSFVSSTKDIKIDDNDINNCASVSVRKVGSDGGSQEGVIFTLYEGPDITGDVVGTCTVNADGDCVDADGENPFVDLNPGEYTIDETNTPAGYTKDADLPDTFTLAVGDSLELEYTNVRQLGAVQVTKTRKFAGATEGDPNSQPHAGVLFTITGGSLPDAGIEATTDADGIACFDELPLDVEYTVTETVPDGYASADAVQEVTPTATATCTDETFVGSSLSFVNNPLTDLDVTVTSQDPGATESTVSCVDGDGDAVGTPISTPVDPAAFSVDDLGIGTYTCTIVIDP